MSPDEIFRYEVTADQAGERVDRVVTDAMPEVTRASVQRWMAADRVTRNGESCRPKEKARAGDLLEVRPDQGPLTDAQPDPSVVVDVLHEDDELIVVNKPAGLVVHPGRGHPTGTLVNGLLARPGFDSAPSDPRDPEGQLRPGIVHRIDKETSGVLVVAKTSLARESLKQQLSEHTVERVYSALTVGAPASGTIRTLHGRDPNSRLRFSSQVIRGKHAVTHVSLQETLFLGRAALVTCRLETGRTHQIRVHLSVERKTPILADTLYGGLKGAPEISDVARRLGRHALHAGVLGFVHPRSGEQLRFESPLPADMDAALSELRALSLAVD